MGLAVFAEPSGCRPPLPQETYAVRLRLELQLITDKHATDDKEMNVD